MVSLKMLKYSKKNSWKNIKLNSLLRPILKLLRNSLDFSFVLILLLSNTLLLSTKTSTSKATRTTTAPENPKNPTLAAVHKALNKIEGTWGLAVIDRDHPEQIIVAKNGSPILIGVGQGQMFVASEAAAFGKYTKEFIALEDGEIAVITADSHTLDRSRIEIAHHENIELSPAPYPHWTIKEIMEQPESLARALNYGGRIKDDSSVKLGGLDQKH